MARTDHVTDAQLDRVENRLRNVTAQLYEIRRIAVRERREMTGTGIARVFALTEEHAVYGIEHADAALAALRGEPRV